MQIEKARTPPSSRGTSRNTPLSILHVEDNADDQILYQAAAKQAGVPIQWHVAESADIGISHLKNITAHNGKRHSGGVDLVLLDLVLPDQSGVAVLKYIRNSPELNRIPVVALTGDTNPVTLKEAHESGVNALHQKPPKFEDSVTLMHTLYTHWSNAARPDP